MLNKYSKENGLQTLDSILNNIQLGDSSGIKNNLLMAAILGRNQDGFSKAVEGTLQNEKNKYERDIYKTTTGGLGGAGLGYMLASLLTKNPWLRALGTGVGGLGGTMLMNLPKDAKKSMLDNAVTTIGGIELK